MVQLGDKPLRVAVFESGGFSRVSPEPLIVVPFTPDYDVVTWKAFEAYTSMGAAFVLYPKEAVQGRSPRLFWCISMEIHNWTFVLFLDSGV